MRLMAMHAGQDAPLTPAQTVRTPEGRDRFAICLDAILAADPAGIAAPHRPGGPLGEGLLSALQGGPVGKAAVRALSPDAWALILRRLYWLPARAGLLPPGPDRAMLALAMRIGAHRAVLTVQQVLGIEEDGVLDPARMPAFTPASAVALEAALDAALLAARRDDTGE